MSPKERRKKKNVLEHSDELIMIFIVNGSRIEYSQNKKKNGEKNAAYLDGPRQRILM